MPTRGLTKQKLHVYLNVAPISGNMYCLNLNKCILKGALSVQLFDDEFSIKKKGKECPFERTK